MGKTLFAVVVLTLSSGCSPADKSPETINFATSKILYLLISEYSESAHRMPQHLSDLDFTALSHEKRLPDTADFQCHSLDGKELAHFLYFPSEKPLSSLPAGRVILASPFMRMPNKTRLVWTADGKFDHMTEDECQFPLTELSIASSRLLEQGERVTNFRMDHH